MPTHHLVNFSPCLFIITINCSLWDVATTFQGEPVSKRTGVVNLLALYISTDQPPHRAHTECRAEDTRVKNLKERQKVDEVSTPTG